MLSKCRLSCSLGGGVFSYQDPVIGLCPFLFVRCTEHLSYVLCFPIPLFIYTVMWPKMHMTETVLLSLVLQDSCWFQIWYICLRLLAWWGQNLRLCCGENFKWPRAANEDSWRCTRAMDLFSLSSSECLYLLQCLQLKHRRHVILFLMFDDDGDNEDDDLCGAGISITSRPHDRTDHKALSGKVFHDFWV